MLTSTIFRDYDIRGVADAELTDAGVEQLGGAIGTYIQRQAGKKINLGRDTRLSSPRLRDALMRAQSQRLRSHRHRRGPHPGAFLLGL